MGLARALEVASELKDAIWAEVDASVAQRALFGRLDGAGLLGRATSRDTFNHRAADLSRMLSVEVAELGRELDLADVSLEALRFHDKAEARQLAESLVAIRQSAEALSCADDINQHLAQRALACVRSYIHEVSPPGAAYTRTGGRAPALSLARRP